jgi:hypothetical protein
LHVRIDACTEHGESERPNYHSHTYHNIRTASGLILLLRSDTGDVAAATAKGTQKDRVAKHIKLLLDLALNIGPVQRIAVRSQGGAIYVIGVGPLNDPSNLLTGFRDGLEDGFQAAELVVLPHFDFEESAERFQLFLPELPTSLRYGRFKRVSSRGGVQLGAGWSALSVDGGESNDVTWLERANADSSRQHRCYMESAAP